MGRKIFPDPSELSNKGASLLCQPLFEKAHALLNGLEPEPTEAKMAYVRQELKPERLQPKIDRLQEGLGAAVAKAQEKAGEATAAVEEALRVGTLSRAPGPFLEQGEAKVSRSDRHREHQEPRRPLERHESTEQDAPRHEPAERKRERRDRRAERRESSEQEAPHMDPKAGG